MKRLLRSLMAGRAPGLLDAVRAIRHRRYFKQRFLRYQNGVREKLFPDNASVAVQSGPFQGLVYLNETVWGSITPKWLGSYEAELHPIVLAIINGRYETVIDVGCAEGYYAVGLAAQIPRVKVFAFDTDFISRRQVRRLAALNNVSDRLHVGTFCHHRDIDALARGKTLVICDIEGFEKVLLNPDLAPSLRNCDILVEVHEASPGSSDMQNLLRSRFGDSHRIDRIEAVSRDAWISAHSDLFSSRLSLDDLRTATEEHRAIAGLWFCMTANARR